MSKSLFSLLLVLLAFFLATSLARPTARKLGFQSIVPIQNFSDQTVQDMGSFAISEYDKTTEYHLEFIKVVNGSMFFVNPDGHPRIWNLEIEAKNCTQPGNTTDIYRSTVNEGFPLGLGNSREVYFDDRMYILGFAGLWKLSD